MNKLICFDFDGTLTEKSSWYLFNTHFGMTPEEDHSLFHQYLENGFDYKNWMLEIVRILKERGRCTKDAVAEFAQTISVREDAQSTITALKEKGYKVIVYSGGLKQVIEPVALMIGADEVYTTAELVFDENGVFHSIIDQSDEMHAKVKAFIALCVRYGIDESEAVVVGDGGNDLEIFRRSKKAIQIGNYEPLKEYAWKQIQSLSEIKELI